MKNLDEKLTNKYLLGLVSIGAGVVGGGVLLSVAEAQSSCTVDVGCNLSTQFCYTDGDCSPGASGTCIDVPSDCDDVNGPRVCGCDDTEYGSACEAYLAGVNISSQADCSCDPVYCVDSDELPVDTDADGCADTCECAFGSFLETWCKQLDPNSVPVDTDANGCPDNCSSPAGPGGPVRCTPVDCPHPCPATSQCLGDVPDCFCEFL